MINGAARSLFVCQKGEQLKFYNEDLQCVYENTADSLEGYDKISSHARVPSLCLYNGEKRESIRVIKIL